MLRSLLNRRLSLLGGFPLLSFVVISLFSVALSAALGYASSAVLTRALLEWEWQWTADLTRYEIRSHALESLFHDPDLRQDWDRYRQALAPLITLPEVVRVKVWNLQGTVIWSDDRELIGKRFSENQELAVALGGKISVELKPLKKAENVGERDRFSTFAEVYVPVFAEKDPVRVIGVVEVYQVPARLLDRIRQARVLVWTISLSGGAILYLALFWTVSASSRAQRRLEMELRDNLTQLDRKTSEQQSLVEASRVLASTLDLGEVLGRLTEIARKLLEVDVARTWLRDEATGDLVLYAHAGTVRSDMQQLKRLTASSGLAGWVMAEARAVAVPDALADSRLANRAWFEAEGWKSFLGVPLLLDGAPVGVLSCLNRAVRQWSPAEVVRAESLAIPATIAIRNAQLYEKEGRALRDVKAAQELLVQGATMRALGEMSAGASHHLNNLLAVVLGRIQLVLAGVDPSQVRRSLEIVARAAGAAAEVVRRLQRFSRMEAAEPLASADLSLVAAEAIEMTSGLWMDAAQNRGITIDVSLDAGVVPPATGNAAALREAVTNLLLNAIDALPNGGRVTVKTFQSGGWACLAVADNGVGMSEDVKQRALEPFFTTKGVKSTGLGLSLSYGVMKRHGGDLQIETTPGLGTTVTMRLPVSAVTEAPRPGTEESASLQPAQASLRILLIDDQEEVREVVADMLRSLGHSVVVAPGGIEALALLHAGETVDMVLTDLGMPGMTGWDVARAVKERWPRLPVGLLTGWGEHVAGAAGAPDLISGLSAKPATLETLRALITACVEDGRRRADRDTSPGPAAG
ncbi:MAG: ATP-binding protein [Gemmatimonadales bacterium]|nr:ATP-binding protein [Gemmatimonadales bacterium]